MDKSETMVFGINVCAVCLSAGKSLITKKIKKAIMGVEGEILIPEGRQQFHKECLKQIKHPDTGSKGEG